MMTVQVVNGLPDVSGLMALKKRIAEFSADIAYGKTNIVLQREIDKGNKEYVMFVDNKRVQVRAQMANVKRKISINFINGKQQKVPIRPLLGTMDSLINKFFFFFYSKDTRGYEAYRYAGWVAAYKYTRLSNKTVDVTNQAETTLGAGDYLMFTIKIPDGHSNIMPIANWASKFEHGGKRGIFWKIANRFRTRLKVGRTGPLTVRAKRIGGPFNVPPPKSSKSPIPVSQSNSSWVIYVEPRKNKRGQKNLRRNT